jgi:hypothetical protein
MSEVFIHTTYIFLTEVPTYAPKKLQITNLNPAILGELEHHVVVNKMQRPVQRVDGHICRPVQLHFGGRQPAGAGQRPPGGAVMLVTHQGLNPTKLVHHADGVPVRYVYLPVCSNGNT